MKEGKKRGMSRERTYKDIIRGNGEEEYAGRSRVGEGQVMMCENDGGRMMVEEKEVHVYTPLRNVGSNGSVQVSSQLFLRGNTIVLYHLWSMGVHTIKVKTEKRASTLALKPRLSIQVSVLQIRIC